MSYDLKNRFEVPNPGWYVDNRWSWGAWILVSNKGDRTILAQGDNAKLAIANGTLTMDLNGVKVRDARPFPAGEWQHVAVVQNEDRLTLYRNGKPAGMQVSDTLKPPEGNFQTGEGPGKLDDLHIYARALNEEEVEALYQQYQVAGR